MNVSGSNNNNYNNYNYNNYNPQPVQQPQQTQQTQTQPVQQPQQTQQQRDYQQDSFSASGTSGSQPNLNGNPQYTNQVDPNSQTQDGVPELGGSDKAGQGVNSAGVPKQSASDLINSSGSKQTYPQNAPEDKGEGYGQEKQNLFNAATQAGASKDEAAIMVSQYMLEGGRDASKDGDAASKNYGPLNLNGDLLKKSGMSQGDMDKMNELDGNGKPTQQALDLTAKAAHAAMQDMGVNGYLNHVRGGQTGYEHPDQQVNGGSQGLISDDPNAFARTVAQSAQKVLETGFDNNRYAGNIPHI